MKCSEIKVIKKDGTKEEFNVQGAVGVAVFLVANIHDGLALFVDLVQHLDEILLVVAVIAVTLCDHRIDALQGALDDIVHLGDRHL